MQDITLREGQIVFHIGRNNFIYRCRLAHASMLTDFAVELELRMYKSSMVAFDDASRREGRAIYSLQFFASLLSSPVRTAAPCRVRLPPVSQEKKPEAPNGTTAIFDATRLKAPISRPIRYRPYWDFSEEGAGLRNTNCHFGKMDQSPVPAAFFEDIGRESLI